jgi:hypothetical protein
MIIMLPPGTELSAATGRVGRTGRYVKIPLAHPLIFLNAVGTSLAGLARRHHTPGQGIGPAKAATHIVASMFGAFNPMGGSFDPTDTDEVTVALLPTAASQAYQLAKGKNAFGGATVPEMEYAKNLPDSEKVSINRHGGVAHDIARWLNTRTGGNPAKPGGIDVAPGTLGHAAEIATGGIGRTAVGVYDLVAAMLGDRTVDPSKTVLAGRFYGKVTQDREVGRFYEGREEIKVLTDQNRQGRKLHLAQDWTDEELAMIRLGRATNSVSRKIAAINSQIRQTIESDSLTDKERNLRIKVLKDRKASLAEGFNTRLAKRLGWDGDDEGGGEEDRSLTR